LANNGEISFFSEAPMEDIYAVNKEVSAVYDAKTNDLVFQLEINDFVFPKSLMQEHFNENYLESDIYPKSIFSGKVISQDGKNAIVEGDLTIHGKTNKIKVEGILQQEKKVINISAEFIVKLEDYDIKIPTIVMYKIAEEIEVKVNIGLKERK
jgi:polyisoprenoid-binding protein YceI